MLQTVKARLKGEPLLYYVQVHQDMIKGRKNLTLPELLNNKCNKSTKVEITMAIHNGLMEISQLTLEVVWVFIGGNKQTLLLEMDLKYAMGRSRSR